MVVVVGLTLTAVPLVTVRLPGVITPVPLEKTAVRLELPPARIVAGLATKLVIVGAGFTVIVAVCRDRGSAGRRDGEGIGRRRRWAHGHRRSADDRKIAGSDDACTVHEYSRQRCACSCRDGRWIRCETGDGGYRRRR